MKSTQAREMLLESAAELFPLGPGFFQMSIILRDAAQRLKWKTPQEDWILLEQMHGLLKDGVFCPGISAEDHSLPFLHPTEVGREILKKISEKKNRRKK